VSREKVAADQCLAEIGCNSWRHDVHTTLQGQKKGSRMFDLIRRRITNPLVAGASAVALIVAPAVLYADASAPGVNRPKAVKKMRAKPRAKVKPRAAARPVVQQPAPEPVVETVYTPPPEPAPVPMPEPAPAPVAAAPVEAPAAPVATSGGGGSGLIIALVAAAAVAGGILLADGGNDSPTSP
jgi:hypothetical protein